MTAKFASKRNGLRMAGVIVIGLGLVGLGHAADRSGKDVVDAICAGCHASGKDGAPRIGNSADWAPRAAKQNMEQLTANAINGVRNMPSHGGQATLSDVEMSRAVAYLVSGGKAADTAKAYGAATHGSGEEIVNATCGGCHAGGKEGAPRIGDLAAWTPRLQKGVDALVHSAVTGHQQMPARGGMAQLSDADIRAAVSFMVSKISGGAK